MGRNLYLKVVDKSMVKVRKISLSYYGDKALLKSVALFEIFAYQMEIYKIEFNCQSVNTLEKLSSKSVFKYMSDHKLINL
jgi:hypothetical protein